MPKKKAKAKSESFTPGIRPLWSGAIVFGLVTIPVSLYSATRNTRVHFTMVDKNGSQLRRRYYCEREEKILASKEIVRGYEVNKNKFITVEDKELEALYPEKTKEINLERFVDANEIHPIFFARSYFVTPGSNAVKPYRLLAQSMEQQQKVGVATFVMRDKQYIVAIIAQAGILRAETLRFADEVRSPEDIGLHQAQEPSETLVRTMTKGIANQKATSLRKGDMQDDLSARIRSAAEKKAKNKRRVLPIQGSRRREEPGKESREKRNTDADTDPNKVVDIMSVIKQRLKGEEGTDENEGYQPTKSQTTTPGRNKSGINSSGSKTKGRSRKVKTGNKKSAARNNAGSSAHGDGGNRKTKREDEKSALRELNRSELYRKAQELNIPGRSQMAKKDLVNAIARH